MVITMAHRNRWFTVLKNGDFPWLCKKNQMVYNIYIYIYINYKPHGLQSSSDQPKYQRWWQNHCNVNRKQVTVGVSWSPVNCQSLHVPKGSDTKISNPFTICCGKRKLSWITVATIRPYPLVIPMGFFRVDFLKWSIGFQVGQKLTRGLRR